MLTTANINRAICEEFEPCNSLRVSAARVLRRAGCGLPAAGRENRMSGSMRGE